MASPRRKISLTQEAVERAERRFEQLSMAKKAIVVILFLGAFVLAGWWILADATAWAFSFAAHIYDHAAYLLVAVLMACGAVVIVTVESPLQRRAAPSADNHTAAMDRWDERVERGQMDNEVLADAVFALSAAKRLHGLYIMIGLIASAVVLAAALQ